MSMRRGVLGLAFLFVGVRVLIGCGIDWKPVEGYFPGVDTTGVVSLTERLSDLDFGEGLKLPLLINFRSDRQATGTILGRGWLVPLVESAFVQTDETKFLLTQPDGYIRPFYRQKDSPSILDGGPLWKAEVFEKEIVVSAGCGWKFRYTAGKITKIQTPTNRIFEIARQGDGLIEIRERGLVKVTIRPLRDEHKVLVTSSSSTLSLGLKAAPIVQSIQGRNLIAAQEDLLATISGGNGSLDEVDYSVTSSLDPEIKLTRFTGVTERYVWSPKTKQIKQNDGWNYTVLVAPGQWSISRINRLGARESFMVDEQKGTEAQETANGHRDLITKFMSGPLFGKTRKSESFANGKLVKSVNFAYDEAGNLLRIVDSTEGVSTFARKALPDGLTLVTKVTKGSDNICTVLAEDGKPLGTYPDRADSDIGKRLLGEILANYKKKKEL